MTTGTGAQAAVVGAGVSGAGVSGAGVSGAGVGDASVGDASVGDASVGDASVGDASARGERRLDAELVRRGLARSRDEAVELVAAGAVTVAGRAAVKAATRVTADTPLTAHRSGPRYVSRGGHKLAGALADLGPESGGAGLTVAGKRCLDVGASTGGFTQVLLHAGAAVVVAVDVGTGQLAPALRADPRVEVRDGVNARELAAEVVGLAELVVADLSFISLGLVMPALARCCAPDGDLLVLVKPQFEVGRGGLDSRGVVRDPAQRSASLLRVAAAAAGSGLGTRAAVASRLPGPAGNVEYFLWLRRDVPSPDEPMLLAAVEDGPA